MKALQNGMNGSNSPFYGKEGDYSQQITVVVKLIRIFLLSFSMPINDFQINALADFNRMKESKLFIF